MIPRLCLTLTYVMINTSFITFRLVNVIVKNVSQYFSRLRVSRSILQYSPFSRELSQITLISIFF